MCTLLVQKLCIFLAVGLFLAWQVLAHPISGENHARAFGSLGIETSPPDVLQERGNICLSCLKPHDSDSGSDHESTGGHELQPVSSHGTQQSATEQTVDQTVLDLWKQTERNKKNYVATGMEKFWPTDVHTGQVYSTGECLGCTVVVVASGKGVSLFHFREEVGGNKPFENPSQGIFDTTVLDKLEANLHANEGAFINQRSWAVVASPGNLNTNSQLTGFKYQTAVNRIQDILGEVMDDVQIRTQGYVKLLATADAFRETAAGKVVVQWLPPSDGGDARLKVYVEDNVVVDAHYNAQGELV